MLAADSLPAAAAPANLRSLGCTFVVHHQCLLACWRFCTPAVLMFLRYSTCMFRNLSLDVQNITWLHRSHPWLWSVYSPSQPFPSCQTYSMSRFVPCRIGVYHCRWSQYQEVQVVFTLYWSWGQIPWCALSWCCPNPHSKIPPWAASWRGHQADTIVCWDLRCSWIWMGAVYVHGDATKESFSDVPWCAFFFPFLFHSLPDVCSSCCCDGWIVFGWFSILFPFLIPIRRVYSGSLIISARSPYLSHVMVSWAHS